MMIITAVTATHSSAALLAQGRAVMAASVITLAVQANSSTRLNFSDVTPMQLEVDHFTFNSMGMCTFKKRLSYAERFSEIENINDQNAHDVMLACALTRESSIHVEDSEQSDRMRREISRVLMCIDY